MKVQLQENLKEILELFECYGQYKPDNVKISGLCKKWKC